MRNSNFSVLPPLGVGVFGKLPAARKRKDRQRNRLGRSERAACPRTESPLEIWLGRSNRPRAGLAGTWTTRVQARQQILPVIGNRKLASDRTHWLQPVPCSSRRRSCPGGERGDRQSSVPADSTRHGHRLPAGG